MNAKMVLKVLRVDHWLKNLLLFLPLVLLGDMTYPIYWFNAFLGFVAFSLMASSMYIFNDIIDRVRDRAHPLKKQRPLANGDVSLTQARHIGAAALLLFGVLLLYFNPVVRVFLLAYGFLVILYTLYLKRQPVLAVASLTSFYLIRLALGFLLVSVSPDINLFKFSFYLFLGLAIHKRFSELSLHNSVDPWSYRLLAFFGISSHIFAVMPLIDFATGRGIALWPSIGLALVFTIWALRFWTSKSITSSPGEPFRQFVRDPTSYLCFVVGALVWMTN